MSSESTQSHTIERLRGQIRYDVLGDGERDVVCWPGGTRPLDDLVPMAEALVERSDVRVVLIQPRGCPGSTLPLGGHTLADLAGDVSAVLDAIQTADAVLAGHAFGNRIMRMTATLRPDVVRGVVLMAAGGLVPETEEFHAAMAVAADATRSDEERLAAFGRAYFEHGSDPANWAKWWTPPSREALRTKRVAPLANEAWWDGGDGPMLIIQGELDHSAPPANGEALAAAHPDRVTLHTVPGAAHTIPVDRPEQCADLISSWIDASLSG